MCLYLEFRRPNRRLTNPADARNQQGTLPAALADAAGQTRRRFGGLTPLCGTGVMSRMAVTVKPTV